MKNAIRLRRAGAALAVAGVAAGLVVSGCGGGDETSTKAQVNSICKDFEAKTKSLDSVTDLPGFATEGKKVVPELSKTFDKLKNVKASDDVVKKFKTDYTAFVQNFADTTAAFEAAVTAAEQGDQDTFDQAGAEITRLDKESDALAKKMGFDDCVSS
jgi:hypothetical protein